MALCDWSAVEGLVLLLDSCGLYTHELIDSCIQQPRKAVLAQLREANKQLLLASNERLFCGQLLWAVHHAASGNAGHCQISDGISITISNECFPIAGLHKITTQYFSIGSCGIILGNITVISVCSTKTNEMDLTLHFLPEILVCLKVKLTHINMATIKIRAISIRSVGVMKVPHVKIMLGTKVTTLQRFDLVHMLLFKSMGYP